MYKLNAKQKTAFAAFSAACLTIVAIHNPTGGYDFTLRVEGGGSNFKQEWQSSRFGCTEALQQEMNRLRSEILASEMSPIEKGAALVTGRVLEISRQCVVTTWWEEPSIVVSEPIWKWVSRDALLPILAPVKNVAHAILFVLLWGAVALFAFRSEKKS